MTDTLIKSLSHTRGILVACLLVTVWLSFPVTQSASAQEKSSGDTLSEQLRKRLRELELEDADESEDAESEDAEKDGDSEDPDSDEEDSEDEESDDEDSGDEDSDEDDLEEDESALSQEQERPSTKVVGGRFVLPAMTAVSTSTQGIGNGSTPKGFRSESPRPLVMLPEQGNDRDVAQTWDWSVSRWDAANTFSNPRYFEDRMLERHGHERWGHLQPLASGVRFFATIPMLPYKMAIQHPCECEYTMGYYRSGSCAPMVYQRPPWDRKAIIAESAAVATGMLIFP